MRDVQQFTTAYWPRPRQWQREGDAIVFTGTDVEYAANLYDPLLESDVLTDFAELGRRAEAGEGDVGRRALTFVRRYGPLMCDDVAGWTRSDGGTFPQRVSVEALLREARALYRAQSIAADPESTMWDRREVTMLARQELEHVRLYLDARLALRQHCPDLLSAIWLLFAQQASGAWRRCKNPGCERLFVLTGRKDREYHSDACKNRASVRKHTEGKRQP